MYALIIIYCGIYGYDTIRYETMRNCTAQVVRTFKTEDECLNARPKRDRETIELDKKRFSIQQVIEPSACIFTEPKVYKEEKYKLVKENK